MTHLLILIGVGVVFWTLVDVVKMLFRRRRERRLKVERLREQSRYLAARGEDVVPAWRITSPRDRVFRDRARQAAWDETQRRRHYGEFD